MDLTPQKINAYAPDAATARRAAGIAHARIWHTLEGNGRAIWGTYGYAPDPFRVAVDFEGPAFKCTCPVRRKPCKHSIALLLIFAKNNDAFRVVTDPPQWAGSWLHKRDQQAVKRTNITREVKRTPEEEKALAEKRRAARDKRIEKMAAGLELFEQWLLDLFRQGLASLENHSCQYWDSLQSRMADAGLTAIARRLRQLPEIMTRHDWHELLLAELGDIYLIVKGFKNIEKLPPLLQDDLLSLSGLNFKKADVLAGAGLKDVWLVVGQTEEQEEAQLIARRTWLVGKQSKHNVLLLDFAWGGKGFDTEFKLGTTAAAEAFFYPSAYPQRVLFADIALTDQPFDPGNGYPDLTAFANAYAKAIGQFPWLAQFPAFLSEVVPVFQNDTFVLVDHHRNLLPVSTDENTGWKLVALSSGTPRCVFGTWDGRSFRPLSIVLNGRVQEI